MNTFIRTKQQEKNEKTLEIYFVLQENYQVSYNFSFWNNFSFNLNQS